MEEEAEKKDEGVIKPEDRTSNEEIFTKVVRAGKRTYFFDVKATRKDDYYLTITESKKRLGREGKIFYEKHKIFLYKEDFEKFTEGLHDAVEFINNSFDTVSDKVEQQVETQVKEKAVIADEEFTNVEFEDLGKK